MGIIKWGSGNSGYCGKDCSTGPYQPVPVLDGEPIPTMFTVEDVQYLGEYVLVRINYPHCKNWDGDKICLYKTNVWIEVSCSGVIDPHFLPDRLSPMARFEPSDEGVDLAVRLLHSLAYR